MADLQIRSELNGVVIEINASVGSQVDEDDVVIILEAMKMEQAVMTPRKGQVQSIHAEVGQLVNEGDLLVTLTV